MFRSVPMVHLRIQVANRDAAGVTRRIASEGLLHLVDLAHGRVAADASPTGTRESLAAFRDLAHRIDRLAERLQIAMPEPEGSLPAAESLDFGRERGQLEGELAPLERSVEEKWRARAAAAERGARLRKTAERLRRLTRAGLDLDRARGLRLTALQFGVLPTEDLATLATLLAPAPFALIPLESDAASTLAAVAVPAGDRARLEEAFRVVSFVSFPISDSPAERDPERIEREAQEADAEATRLSSEIAEAADGARTTLDNLSRRARTSALLLQAQTFFASAGRFVVISGWVPEESAEKMRRALATGDQGRVIVEIDKPEDLPEVAAGSLKVPILHRNPLLLRPFQKLVEMYGTPSYAEVEPTAFFAVSFLVMFGLMFGDVGHGFVLFLAGYCLFRWIPRYLDYGILLMEVGAASVLFGFLYGSFFGIEGALPVLWMEPMKDLHRFLTVAIGLGVLLVSAGLVLNLINTWRSGEREAALFGARGLLPAFGYWVIAGLALRALISRDFRLPAWAVLALAAVPVLLLAFKRPLVALLEKGRPARRGGTVEGPRLLVALESSVELVDSVVSFFANTISFLRVAAFAMVHAGAFIALFALADTLARMRGGGALSVALLVAGNVVILFLEGLVVSVQVLRLEYFEFFGKFFRGGGEPYRPLMLRAGAAKGESR